MKFNNDPKRLKRLADAEDKYPTGPAECELCGEPMPEGEEMFNYHGYSGPCPKPPLPRSPPPVPAEGIARKFPTGSQWDDQIYDSATGEVVGERIVGETTPSTERGQLRPIAPVGAKIIDHPDFKRWFKQGYARQEADGLWLHYAVICTLLAEAERVLGEGK